MHERFEIFVHTADNPDGLPVTVGEATTVELLLREIFPSGHEEILLVVDGEDQPREREHRLPEFGVHKGHHIHCRPHLIHYEVDGERQKTELHRMTPVQIMQAASVNPQNHYLIRLKSHKEEISYKDQPNVHIHMHDRMKFITGSLGPTPVS